MLETEIGLEARLERAPMRPGDVQATFADVADLECDFGFRPTTGIEDGVRRLVAWYRDYHRPRSAAAISTPNALDEL